MYKLVSPYRKNIYCCFESRHTCFIYPREVSGELNGLLADCGEGKSEVNLIIPTLRGFLNLT